MMNASIPGRGGEHRTEPVAPVPNRLVADIDVPPEQEILHLPRRQRIYIITVRRITLAEMLI